MPKTRQRLDMNEIVQYHNDLNTIALSGLTESQINLLFSIFAKIKNKDTTDIKFHIDDLIRISGISTTNKGFLENAIFGNLAKLQNLKLRYETDKVKAQKVIFPDVELERATGELSIKVNETFSYLFNEFAGNFTRFELAEFVNLSGKYSKTLYRLLKQYRSSGWFRIEWDKFTDLMDMPQKMAMRDIEKRILKPATKELSTERNLFDQRRTPFKKLEYSKKKEGKGNKITHIEFYFEPELIDLIETNPELKRQQELLELKSELISQKFNFNNQTYKILELERTSDKLKTLCLNENTNEQEIINFKSAGQLRAAVEKFKQAVK